MHLSSPPSSELEHAALDAATISRKAQRLKREDEIESLTEPTVGGSVVPCIGQMSDTTGI